MKLDKDVFLNLLSKLVGETKYLQNNPPKNIPREDLAGNHIINLLDPYSTKNNGVLMIERINYVKDRNNIIIKYPGTTDKTISFIGSHLDVVPADQTEWKHDPFMLSIDGDKLYGRGTTDCLGNVAMLTDLMRQLAITKPKLETSIIVVFIANEENSIDDTVGVEHLFIDKKLEICKGGPLYWVDSTDIYPTVVTGSCIKWKMEISGKKGHSGKLSSVINPVVFGMEVMKILISAFYRQFPRHQNDLKYGLTELTNFKPTYFCVPEGSSVNQIPDSVTIKGDIRGSPFYRIDEMKNFVNYAVQYINDNLNLIPKQHPSFKYIIDDNIKAHIKFEWDNVVYPGIACNLESSGYKILKEVVTEVMGKYETRSTLGSLPSVLELQKAGYDIQLIGFGRDEQSHANDEFCLLSDMEKGFQIINKIISKFNLSN